MLQPAAFIPPCLPPHLCLLLFLASLSPSARVHISGYLHFYSSTHSCEEHFESTSWRLRLFCFDNYPCRHKFSCNFAVMSLFSFHCDGKRKGPFYKTYVILMWILKRKAPLFTTHSFICSQFDCIDFYSEAYMAFMAVNE